ncbi:MAG: PKD domain-containing protein [Candidatus Thorarchaeota archaeon]
MKSKRILAVWLAILVLGFGVTSVSGAVILNPGFITGTIDVTNLVGTEAVIGGSVNAYSLEGDFEGHDYSASGGNYFVTVEGAYDYKVFSEARIWSVAPDESYHYESTVSIGSKNVHVEIDETVEGFNFLLDTYGRIEPRVTVLGGDIDYMVFYVVTDIELPPVKYYTALHKIWSDVGFLNDVQTTFPMRPWLSIDANGDGRYTLPDDSFVKIDGMVLVDGVQYQLLDQYIDVIASQTTTVEWTLDLSSSIHGNVVVQDEEFTYYTLYGNAWIGPTWVNFIRKFYPIDGHDMNLYPETWSVYPNVRWTYSSNNWNSLRLPQKVVTLESGDRSELNWDINPGYVGGSVDLYGAYGNLYVTMLYGTDWSGGYAVSTRTSDEYRLILYPGSWDIGRYWTFLHFNYDKPNLRSRLQIVDSSSPQIDVESGIEVSGVDLSYGTATVTVNYRVQLPGGEYGYLKSPYLIATSSEGTGPDQIDSIAEGWGSPVPTDLGECTITVLPGTHIIGAYATVEGSYTKFGEFTITVETGDVVTQDVDAPTVDISQPGGSEHVCASSVDVAGTTTDDSGVKSITVNGAEVEFSSTENPDDENEVFFSTNVGGLVVNEWNIISIVVTDNFDNSITIERQVFRDPCNLPPVIETITGPLDPVSVGIDFEMFGEFTDPDIDDTHTAIWDWGDGTTSAGTVDQTARTVAGSHVYETPGVYTVKLTVVDSFGESDTKTWSQYCVIYDPSAGFVTGGGWIDSPPGAYVPDPSLSGKANFGFVSKYRKGSTEPTGNTEFQFKAGDLNFHSDAYEWMVIAGAKAMFKGTGTINGEGSYKFLLTAIDGDLSDDGTLDTFRIKIWTEDEETGAEIIRYDSGEIEISGGSIKIHSGGPN